MAVNLFKNVMGWMGDKPNPYPQACALEVLIVGIQEKEMRSEIYAQIIKQLTGNEKENSRTRGWKLLHLCLKCFTPGNFENYLDHFIRTTMDQPNRLLKILYERVLFDQVCYHPKEYLELMIKNVQPPQELPTYVEYKPLYTAKSHPQLVTYRNFVKRSQELINIKH